MNYEPGSTPLDDKALGAFIGRELRRLSSALRDNAPTVFYRTNPANQGSLTAGVSANWKIVSGNVIRISASATVTLTGLALSDPTREIVLINVGTAAVMLKNQGTESSASYRFALSTDWNLSQNAAATLFYDPFSSRWRGISRT